MTDSGRKPRKWVRPRKYNRVYRVGGFIFQVMLGSFQNQRFALRVIPSLTIAHNEKMVWVIGLDWMFGDVNFGWAYPDFIESEKARMGEIEKQATKTGITIKQQKLRWEGY
jgi:hypothetical protein